MGIIVMIRPRDDAASQQASDWADDLLTILNLNGHSVVVDVDDTTPPDTANIVAAVGKPADLVCYFGHGDETSWLTSGSSTLSASSATGISAGAVVSVACKTGCSFGPGAVTAGVRSWLGFTIKVPVIAPHKTKDPMGEAIVNGIAQLATQGTMQMARDEIVSLLDQVVTDYDFRGRYSSHPGASFGYFAAMALRDHVVVHGNHNLQPLP
jgi:hypothetical protein